MQSDTVPLINKKRGKKKLTRLKKSILGFLACTMLWGIPTAGYAAEDVQVWGKEKVKYDNNVIEGKTQTKIKYTTTLGLKQKVDDHWSWKAGGQNESTYDYSKDSTKFLTRWAETSLTYKNKGTSVIFGRDSYTPGYGMIVSGEMTGLQVSQNIGDKLNMKYYRGYDKYKGSMVTFGGEKYLMSSDTSGKEEQRINIQAFDATYKFDKKWEAKAARYGAELDQTGQEATYWEVGAKYKANKDWSILVEQGRSDANAYNMANAIMIQYKGIDTKKVGSYGVRVGHYRVEKFAMLDTDYTKGTGHSVWGTRIGFVPAKNTSINLDYFVGKCPEDSSKKLHGYAVTANFAF